MGTKGCIEFADVWFQPAQQRFHKSPIQVHGIALIRQLHYLPILCMPNAENLFSSNTGPKWRTSADLVGKERME